MQDPEFFWGGIPLARRCLCHAEGILTYYLLGAEPLAGGGASQTLRLPAPYIMVHLGLSPLQPGLFAPYFDAPYLTPTAVGTQEGRRLSRAEQ